MTTWQSAEKLDPQLRAGVLARHRSAALQLLADAVEAWRQAGCTRFDDHEVSCTVRVFSFLEQLTHARIDTSDWITAAYEQPVLTQDQLEGLTEPSTAKRPDLRLMLRGGLGGVIHVECKRLVDRTGGRQYAGEGIARFVRGDYPTQQGEGAMLGYVMDDTIPHRVAEIDDAVANHPELGPSHTLGSPQPLPPIADAYRSRHVCGTDRQFGLTHLFVAVR